MTLTCSPVSGEASCVSLEWARLPLSNNGPDSLLGSPALTSIEDVVYLYGGCRTYSSSTGDSCTSYSLDPVLFKMNASKRMPSWETISPSGLAPSTRK